MKKMFSTLLLLALLSLGACTSTSSPDAVTSANLMDYTIKSQDGDTLGIAKDVILDLESGQISYVIMVLPPGISTFNKAAFVPSSTNQTAIPWEALQQVEANATDLILVVEERVVYAAPRLTDDLDTLKKGWDSRVQAYWQTNLK